MIATSTNVRNSIWNLANILIYPTLFLAATPFFINQLSESEFGIWMLINSYIFISVHIIGFGIPNAITAHVAEAKGLNDNNLLNAYINAASRLFGRMSFFTILGAILIFLFYYFEIEIFEKRVLKVLIIATLLIAVKFPELLYQNIFKGFERYDSASVFNMINRIGALGAQFYLVWNGYGLYEIFVATLTVNILLVLIQAIVVYSRLKGYTLKIFQKIDVRTKLYHFGFWTWLQTIIGVLSFQLDRFVVAYFLGTATVAYYVLASTIANHLHMAYEASVSWMFPKIARIKETKIDTRPYFHTVRAFSVGFSLLVIFLLVLISDPLFNLWLGPDKYPKMIGFFYLFMIFECLLIFSIVPKIYLNAIKDLKFITSMEFLFKSGIILGLSIAFAIFKTADSLIWGQIIALTLLIPVEYFLVNKRILHENAFQESIVTMLPGVFVMCAILSSQFLYIALFGIMAALSFWIYYIRIKQFSLKLLLE